MDNHYDAGIEGEEIDISEIINIIKAQKVFIAIVMVFSFIVACVYIINIPPKYQSTALIQINGDAGGMGGLLKSLDSSVSSEIIFGGRGASPAQVETALMTSRFILQPTIESLGLNISVKQHYFPIFGAYIARHYKGEGLAKPFMNFTSYSWGGEKVVVAQFVVPDDYYNKQFKLKVGKDNSYKLYSPDGKFVLEGTAGISAESSEFSVIPGVKILANSVEANSGTEFYVSASPTGDLVGGLANKLSVVDIGVSGASGVATGIMNVGLVGEDPERLPKILNTVVYYDMQKNADKKTAELQKTLNFLLTQSENLRNELDIAEGALSDYKGKEGVLGVSVGNQVLLGQLVEMQKNIEELQFRKAELLQTFTEEHPYITAINLEQKNLQGELHDLEAKVQGLPKSEQRMITLQRDVRVKSQLYTLMLNKIQQLQVIKEGTMSDVRVLGWASPAVRVPSKASLIALASLLFGFVLSIAIVFVRNFLFRSVNDPDYLESRLGIPLYALIPFSKKQKELYRDMKSNIPGTGPFILAVVRSKDLVIEGLRSLRTSLQFAQKDTKSKIITILGSSPGIGKSFVSVNFAHVLASSGKKVLLIDADLRRGKTNEYLLVDGKHGLSDILVGEDLSSKLIKSMIHRGQIDFIATGKHPHNPSELLASGMLKKLLDKVAPQYDFIIIDTPPILAVSDSTIIIKQIGDSINLLLVGAGVENLKSVEHSAKRMQKSNIHIDGIIFNNAALQGYGYYGKYGYYNYYYYDYSRHEKKQGKGSKLKSFLKV